MNRKPILFDSRSTQLKRTTGWERYATGLAGQLRNTEDVLVRTADSFSTFGLLRDGQTQLPKDLHNHRVAHYPTFPPSFHALKAADKSGTKLIWTIHDLTWWKTPSQASFLGRNYYRHLARRAVKSSHLVTPSQAIKEEIVDLLGLTPLDVTVIPNGVSETFIDQPIPQPEKTETERPYFLYVGTIEPRKNLTRLMKAFELSGLSTSHDFWLVGRKGWGSTPRGVIEKGVLDDKALLKAYQDATALVLVSLDEGFGIPVIESLTSGTPVLTSSIPVFKDLQSDFLARSENSRSFELVEPKDHEAIAVSLKNIARSPRLVKASEIYWAKEFTWAKSSSRHHDLYQSFFV